MCIVDHSEQARQKVNQVSSAGTERPLTFIGGWCAARCERLVWLKTSLAGN